MATMIPNILHSFHLNKANKNLVTIAVITLTAAITMAESIEQMNDNLRSLVLYLQDMNSKLSAQKEYPESDPVLTDNTKLSGNVASEKQSVSPQK